VLYCTKVTYCPYHVLYIRTSQPLIPSCTSLALPDQTVSRDELLRESPTALHVDGFISPYRVVAEVLIQPRTALLTQNTQPEARSLITLRPLRQKSQSHYPAHRGRSLTAAAASSAHRLGLAWTEWGT
jgi:hypothetical protein